MIFDRAAMLGSLRLAKLGVHSQDFIPVHACFCFTGKHVYGYNNVVAVRTEMHTDTAFGVEADVLYKVLDSMSVKDVTIEQSKEELLLKAKGTMMRMPTVAAEDFQLKWPKMEGLSSMEMTREVNGGAAEFFTALERCMTSIGDGAHRPAQMGITVNGGGDKLFFYSTNDRALSRYVATGEWKVTAENLILPTSFCKAAIELNKEFPAVVVKWSLGKNFVVLSFGDRCELYGKLLENDSPLRFESVIKKHMDGTEVKQEISDKLASSFERASIVVSPELRKSVMVKIEKELLRVEAESRLGVLRESCRYSKDWKQDMTVWMDCDLLHAALESSPKKIAFSKTAVGFFSNNYTHLIQVSATKPS